MLPAFAQPALHIIGSSDRVAQGISQTLGDPTIQAGLSYSGPSGVYGGLWLAENSLISARSNQEPATEINTFLGLEKPFFDGATWSAHISRYTYAGNSFSAYDYSEILFGANWNNGVSIALGLTDNLYHSDSNSAYYEAAYDTALSQSLIFNVGLGWHDVEQIVHESYWYWNISLTKSLGPIALDISYIDTSDNINRIFDARATGPHWLTSIVVKLF